MERLIGDREKQDIVNGSVVITKTDQLPSYEVAQALATQVSLMIHEYNSAHPYEMIPKGPEELMNQFEAGHSVFMVTEDYGNGNFAEGIPTVLYHGTIYPNFENGEQKLFGMQIVEFGSSIAHPDFRGGYGLGTLGVDRRMYIAQEEWGPNVLAVSTTKQVITLRSLNRGAGMTPVSYWEYPYLSYLTCTCTNCSERFGFSGCVYRRPQIESQASDFLKIVQKDYPFGPIDCTLLVSDVGLAEKFQTICSEYDEKLTGNYLPKGQLTIESMQKAEVFFKSLRGS